MNHHEARMLASALADGELEPARLGELDEHLASCDPCRAFAGALPQLSVLAAALPREHAPSELPHRVRARLSEGSPPTIRVPRWRMAPALAAALVVALVALLVGSVPIVRVPSAEAARALSRISSLFIERELTTFDESGRPDTVTRERLWFKAPGMIRTESETDGRKTLVIERPGLRYQEDHNGRFLNTGMLPSTTPLPEPLTPMLAILGGTSGDGPVVLGRPTRRIELMFGGERREALVDAETFAVLGVTESLVLGKETFEGDRVVATKRTLALEYNVDVADSLFRVPEGATVIDHGAEPRPLGTLTAPPAGPIEGLALVAAVAGSEGEAILYAKGAFQILVEIDGLTALPSPSRTQTTFVGSRRATLVLPLFGLPEVRFSVGTHRVAVRAPLAPPLLQELARQMYPSDGE